MARMAKISKSSKRFSAYLELLKGTDAEAVAKKYGVGVADLGRCYIQYQAEARKILGQATVQGVTKKAGQCGLINGQFYLNRMSRLVDHGSKAVFLGGFHGLGKTTLVYELAKQYNAEVIRLQVSELLTEIEILGGVDPQTGNFILSEFVQAILKAKEDSSKTYFLLLDEFTRGRPEALNILFPVLAEKTLYNNSAYAKPEHKVITLPDNIKVFGTGNTADKGLRDVGEAEFDRWNGIEVLPLTKTSDLKQLISEKSKLTNESAISKLLGFYNLSWQYGNEERILPMSHRTLIETANIAASFIEDGVEGIDAVKQALEFTYLTTSQAVLNENYRQTYKQMIREVF